MGLTFCIYRDLTERHLNNTMNIAVYKPNNTPLSMNIYLNKICQKLVCKGVKFTLFQDVISLPQEVDIFWDPRLGAGGISALNRNITNKPIILTIHGTSLFSSRLKDNRWHYSQTLKLIRDRLIMKRTWRYFADHYNKIITVSDFAKREIVKHLSIAENLIEAIYLAADTNLFYPLDKDDLKTNKQKPYLFHVSVYQPMKNLKRIIKAYLSIAENDNIPDFLIVAPNFPDQINHPKIKLITKKVTPKQVGDYMRYALAFVFPSLHESFGLPIVEAMACGLPVITSNTNACPEIAGDAALLVNPHSKNAIADAMIKIIDDNILRDNLSEKGLIRAGSFSWEKCADEHLSIFENTLKKRKL
jgi:glycosyltransferase involved in cell wall biosynthesis